MNIPDAISELGRQIGLSDLALNEMGLCRVVFDDRLAVDFEARTENNTLLLSSVVIPPLSLEKDETFFAALLKANLFGMATGGARFSFSEAEDEVIFEQEIEMEALDFTSFNNTIESYVNHLEGWSAKFAAGQLA